MSRLVVVSNRVGPMEEADARAGGLAVALRDALKRTGGVWFGWSGQVDAAPPEQPHVTVRGRVTFATVDLGPEDYEDYYKGFANGSLWPLFHYRLGLFEYNRREYAGYRRVNAEFARKLGPLLRPDDIIWVHDYHLIPLGAELRRAGHANRIGIFLHTPLPTTEVMIALPCHDGLMQALCAYDLVGLQTKTDLRAFTDYIENEAGGSVGGDGGGGECIVRAFGRTLRAGAFPISIDTETFAATAASAADAEHTLRLKRSLLDRHLIIGVDRLDYSKGLVPRFESIGQLLTAWPEHRSRVTFLQIAPPSRGDIAQYQELRSRLEGAAGHINGRFAEF
ncbi:MAG: trehalose-6-phosphate synthase, partial [Dongiaceae bacterium]